MTFTVEGTLRSSSQFGIRKHGCRLAPDISHIAVFHAEKHGGKKHEARIEKGRSRYGESSSPASHFFRVIRIR